MSVELWLTTPTGTRIAHCDTVQELEYVRVLNQIGTIAAVLPSDYDSLLSLDKILELWIDNRFITVGFIRKFRLFDDANGVEKTLVVGYTPNYLLDSRIVAYAAETSQASMTDVYADDMLKEIVKDNLGSDASSGRNISSLNFSIDNNLSAAPRITKSFAWRNLYDVCLDICAASEEEGTRLYFDIVPYWYSSEVMGFRFITYINQPGSDFGTESNQPRYFGKQWGNLLNATLEYDHSDEITFVYAGGQGEGSDRTIVTVSDTTRIGESVWNRREKFADARNESSSSGVEAKAYKALNEGRPKITLDGVITENNISRWGIDWDFGDKVVVEYRGVIADAIINKIEYRLSADGNSNLAFGFDVVGNLPGIGFGSS